MDYECGWYCTSTLYSTELKQVEEHAQNKILTKEEQNVVKMWSALTHMNILCRGQHSSIERFQMLDFCHMHMSYSTPVVLESLLETTGR